jgi:6-pyruvoyl-tetrahydropterin synthase related domain
MLQTPVVLYSLTCCAMPEHDIGSETSSRKGLELVRFERLDSPSPLSLMPLLVIAGAAFAVIVPFFFLGIPSGHDFEFHLNSWMEALGQWKLGIAYPRWASLAHYGYGEPRFIFYPPLSWMLGAALGAVLPWTLTSGAYIWLVLTLAGCTMFLLARNWLSRRDALFAAVLYAVNPYHLLIVYWRSAFAELLAGALLPLLFLCLLRLEEEGRKWIVPLALIIAAIWLSNAPSAVMASYSLTLLAVLIAAVRRSPRILWQVGLAATLGMALAAFYILPAAYEQRWVDIFQVLSGGVRPRDNFLFTTVADAEHNRFNQLISAVAVAELLGLAAAGFWWRRWRRRLPQAWWLLAIWASAAALLLFRITGPVWDHLPQLRYMQLPWRWLLGFNLAFALLIATAWRRWEPRLLVAALMLAALLFAGNRFQPPWWDHILDIAELRENVRTGLGYEGTDEYTPVDADSYQTRHDAPLASFQGQSPEAQLQSPHIEVERWTPELKLLTAQASAPGWLVLRLFHYPAWKAEVNGQPVAAESRDVTGQIMIPVQAGENRVQVKFVRTWDRTAGGLLSVTTALILGLLSMFTKRENARTTGLTEDHRARVV